MRPYPTPPRPQCPVSSCFSASPPAADANITTRRLGETSARSEGKAGEETWSLSDSTISPRFLHAEADGNRTRLGARAPTTVLKTAGPTRNPDASGYEDSRRHLRVR